MSKEKVDVGTPEGKELLLNYVKRIQSVDNNIKEFNEEKKDILDEAKSHGFDKSMITKTITAIRKEQDTDTAKAMEEDMYYTLIKESCLVQSVKI